MQYKKRVFLHTAPPLLKTSILGKKNQIIFLEFHSNVNFCNFFTLFNNSVTRLFRTYHSDHSIELDTSAVPSRQLQIYQVVFLVAQCRWSCFGGGFEGALHVRCDSSVLYQQRCLYELWELLQSKYVIRSSGVSKKAH